MRGIALIVVVVCCCCSLPGVLSAPLWGAQGHEITGLVAQGLLTTAAQTKVSSILGGQTLAEVSTWADDVKRAAGYTWSAVLHYIDTPDWACTYEHARDCVNNQCVAGAIANYTTRLANTKLPGTQINEALKFLTHFCGDIHQPLHVGFTTDAGGNTITGTYEGKKQNLHAIWDTPLVLDREKAFNSNEQQYADWLLTQIRGDWKSKAAAWATCANGATECADAWAVESVKLACSNAYVDQNGNKIENGFSLTSGYFTFNQDVIDEQLAKGGVRLAHILNTLLGASTEFMEPTIVELPSNLPTATR